MQNWKLTLNLFFVDSRNYRIFISPEVYFYIKKNQRTFFGREVGSSLPPLRSGCQERGIVVRWTRLSCTRLRHRTCKTSRSSKKASLPGLSGHFASLVGSKKVLLTWGVFYFFQKIPPLFKLEVWFFSAKKSFSQNFNDISFCLI